MEQEPRTPDPSYNDMLLPSHHHDDNTDDELARILEQSRNEYLALEQIRLQQEALKSRLSVPISRLVLWKNTTTHPDEKECLEQILHILHVSTASDHMGIGVIKDIDRLRLFLDTHLQPSPLFKETHQVCMQYLL